MTYANESIGFKIDYPASWSLQEKFEGSEYMLTIFNGEYQVNIYSTLRATDDYAYTCVFPDYDPNITIVSGRSERGDYVEFYNNGFYFRRELLKPEGGATDFCKLSSHTGWFGTVLAGRNHGVISGIAYPANPDYGFINMMDLVVITIRPI